jgi:RDD family
MTKEKEIQFKALTPGLGFHPFANGLPYSPPPNKFQDKFQDKAQENKPQEKAPNFSGGTGAYTAGRPSFAFPKAQTKPIQAQAIPIVPKPLLHADEPLGFEYLLKRVLAFFVDSFLNILLSTTILGICLWNQSNNFDFMMNTGVLMISACFLIFFNWAMITSQEILFHTSIGKKIFGLRLQGSLGAILGRAVLFIPSAAFFGLGIIWTVFNKNRMSWYDAATGIQPKEVAEL